MVVSQPVVAYLRPNSGFLSVLMYVLMFAFCLPTYANTYNVTSNSDSSATGTLRWAITQANSVPGSTITFNSLSAITLNSTLPTVTSSMTINQTNGPTITINGKNGANNYTAFSVQGGSTIPVVTFNKFTIQNCGNLTSSGSAVIDGNATLNFDKCSFSGNYSKYTGGVVFASGNGNMTFTNCSLTANSSKNGGGAVYNLAGPLTLTNSIISNNSSSGPGGGIYTSAPTMCTNCIVNNNASGSSTITGSSGSGAGIYGGNPLTLSSCTISNNVCYTSDHVNYPTEGGGICLDNGMINFINSTIYENSADKGGGLYINIPQPAYITNCDIAYNTATIGGGIYLAYSPTIPLLNDIFYGNTATTNPEIEVSGGTLTASYSDIQGGYPGTGNINITVWPSNPGLSVPGPNTMPVLVLPSSSSCFDTGSHNGAPLLDERGVTRPNPPSIGAYDL